MGSFLLCRRPVCLIVGHMEIPCGSELLWRGGLPVARGLAPVGLRSGPAVFSDTPHLQLLRLLRSRTGASPLATGYSLGPRVCANLHAR
ncbi:hypothetical protein FQ192_13240 [Pseudomonas sp. ANT_J12]|nr:hypothetical protein FQ192_13240 [Pseudomonas sp. ANT_J12]